MRRCISQGVVQHFEGGGLAADEKFFGPPSYDKAVLSPPLKDYFFFNCTPFLAFKNPQNQYDSNLLGF